MTAADEFVALRALAEKATPGPTLAEQIAWQRKHAGDWDEPDCAGAIMDRAILATLEALQRSQDDGR